ncbi:hypothetical protein Tco_0704738 [Tanacetum coccineum]|uniref:Uncharacterized protein n=1 Tax=Tanacetum coccineum TaxID=301880 RepID=A0ABQ4Y3C5_9ASTR
MQTQEDHSNPILALNVDSLKVDLVVIQNTCSEKEDSNSEAASSKLVKECSLNYETKDVHAIKYRMSKAKERCMAYFRSLHLHLQVLSKDDLKGTHIEHGFKRAFMSLFELVAERTRHQRQYERRVNKRQMQTQESKIDTGKALDNGLVVMESNGTESEVQDDSSRSGNDTNADDADIRPIYDEEPMVEIFKFDKTSVLGKLVIPSLRNQSVVRQPNAFKSERAKISKQRFASQVDVNKNFSKPVNQHYLAKKIESAFAKPDHMIASSSSRNSSKNMPRFSSNDMVHNHYLDVAKKKIQERDRNSTTSVTTSARIQTTADDSKPKPRSNNQTSRSLPVSKSSRVTITAVPKSNHCKIQSHETRNSNKPIDQKNHTQKPGRQIFTGHRFSPNKTSAVYEKTSPRSDLRWKTTGRIFKSVGLRWIPTGKLFDSCTSKVDSEPPHGSNIDILNIHECKQTLDVSAGTSINVQKEQSLDLSAEVHQAAEIVTMSNELDLLFGPLFDEYFNGENQVVLKSSAVTTTDASNKRQQQPDSTSSTSTLATTVTANGNFNL